MNIDSNRNFYNGIQPIKDPDNITVLVDKFHQLPSDYIPYDLEIMAPCYNPEGLKLRHDARVAFEIMSIYASVEGIHLEAVSAFRSYDYQETVYFKNWTPDISLEDYQRERDRVSARPGHSEHQTGLAVDINDLEQSFEETEAGKWLAGNSYRYGFILRYPKGKELITGYDYEPWHFRYVGKPLAKDIYCSDLTYDEFYKKFILYNDWC